MGDGNAADGESGAETTEAVVLQRQWIWFIGFYTKCVVSPYCSEPHDVNDSFLLLTHAPRCPVLTRCTVRTEPILTHACSMGVTVHHLDGSADLHTQQHPPKDFPPTILLTAEERPRALDEEYVSIKVK
jgi:hypothetical protein